MNSPGGVSVDVSGNVFIIDYRKIRMVSNTGIITTVAGTGEYGSSVDGGAATSATLNWPTGISVDISGNLYIVETDTNKIRMVTSAGIITTFAGTGTYGDSGDGGAATSAHMDHLLGVAVDRSGNVYIADADNNKIRMVTRPRSSASAMPSSQPSHQPTIQPTSQVNQKRHHFIYL